MTINTPISANGVSHILHIIKLQKNCTSARSRLNAHHVNELCCLHQWLLKHDDMMSREATRKAGKTAQADERFARLNLRLELNDPEVIESDEDDEDDDNGDDGDD